MISVGLNNKTNNWLLWLLEKVQDHKTLNDWLLKEICFPWIASPNNDNLNLQLSITKFITSGTKTISI